MKKNKGQGLKEREGRRKQNRRKLLRGSFTL